MWPNVSREWHSLSGASWLRGRKRAGENVAAARITDRYKAIHPPKLRQKLAAVDEERPTVPGTQARRRIIWQLHTDDLPTAFDENSQKHNALLRMIKTRSTLTTRIFTAPHAPNRPSR